MVASRQSAWRFKTWFWASRPFSLQASIAPVLVGTAIAYSENIVNWTLFIIVLGASVLLQIATNLTDEYSDHKRTGSTSKFLAPHKVIERGLLTESQVLIGMLVTFGISIILGLYVTWQLGWPIFAVSVGALTVAYFYSSGPFPLGNIGLGEPLVFIFMGPVIVMGAYYVQVEQITWISFFVSLPIGCLVASILHCNNLRDIEEDRKEGKRSIARLIGPKRSRWLYAILLFIAYGSIAIMVATSTVEAFALVALITLPTAGGNIKRLWEATDRTAMNGILLRTSNLHGRTGLALALGLALGNPF